MSNQYYGEIIEGLNTTFAELGFKQSPDVEDVYLNDKKAVKVEYNEERRMFLLNIANIIEGEGVNFSEVSGWLFDKSHGSKDAKVIAEDFAKCIKAAMGIPEEKSAIKHNVSLPTRNAEGTTAGVDAFAKRFMDIFPQYKDYYKESFGKYGEFMYEDFFRNTAAVKLRELVTSKDPSKKHIVKLFDLLNDMYVEGDNNVKDMVMFTILGGAFGGDVELFDSKAEYYADCPYIKQNGRFMITTISRNKKYREALK